MFLAILSIPDAVDAAERAAAATGLALVDVKRRLSGILPRVLFVGADREAMEATRQRLETAGFAALAFDPASSPTDEDRIIGRNLELEAEALVVVAGVGSLTRHMVPWTAFELLQRGTRANARREQVVTSSRKLAIGRTLLAGGLPMTKKVERIETVVRGADERFALLHRSDGGDDIVLYETRLDYRFLGERRQPTSHANFEAMLEVLRARVAIPEDDRVARPGFVTAIPACSTDAVDVSLHLVRLARLAGGSSALR
jgi:hypothetical protein